MSKDRDEFVAVLTRELPDWSIGQVVDLAAKLMRYGRLSHRLAEALCNRELTAAEERQDTANDERIRLLVATLGVGFGCMISGDPRGATVKLILPSRRSNSFGGEGWCVPGS